MTADHIQQIRSSYRAKLRKAGELPPLSSNGAPAPRTRDPRGGRMTAQQGATAMQAMERELVKLALEIGFSRAALVIDEYRVRLANALEAPQSNTTEHEGEHD